MLQTEWNEEYLLVWMDVVGWFTCFISFVDLFLRLSVQDHIEIFLSFLLIESFLFCFRTTITTSTKNTEMKSLIFFMLLLDIGWTFNIDSDDSNRIQYTINGGGDTNSFFGYSIGLFQKRANARYLIIY